MWHVPPGDLCPHHDMRALVQGDNVTQGLRKVTDDMKTKNRADRSGAQAVILLSPAQTVYNLCKWWAACR